MGFFEYLAFNNVDAVLMFTGFIGFIATLIILAVYLDNASNFGVRIIKSFVPPLIIFCSVFFIGLLLPGDGYFKEMRLRKNMKTIDVTDVNFKFNEIINNLESIKDKLKIEGE